MKVSNASVASKESYDEHFHSVLCKTRNVAGASSLACKVADLAITTTETSMSDLTNYFARGLNPQVHPP